MTKIDLTNQPKPELFRVTSAPLPNQPKIIDREGGDYGAGLISGMSAITRGEALGHGLWIDDVFLQQVADALTAAGESGVKSRFTHPDMSADGLAKFLGRAKFGRVQNGHVITTLHLAKSAHKSPDGDLAGYVLDRTEEDPASFGASIVFIRDMDAEATFAAEHGGSVDCLGEVDLQWFQSPDPENKNNFLHARLLSLEAADLVDEPAANPSGMFHHVNPVGELAELADYALKLSDTPPAETTALAVNPDRLRGFVDRYLANRKLKIVPLEDTPPPAATDPPPPETPAPAETDPPTPDADGEAPGEPKPDEAPAPPVAAATGPDKTLAEYCTAFGHADGARFFLAAVPFADAQQQAIESLRAANAELAARFALSAKEHPAPLPLNSPRKSLRDLTRIRS